MASLTQTENAVLTLLSAALFDAEPLIPHSLDLSAILTESLQQAVLPLVYAVAEPQLSPEIKSCWKSKAERILASNIRVDFEHIELNDLLTAHHVPYVFLKGVASAHYYPDPVLRTMGDVDFLISESDMERTGKLLEGSRFYPEEDTEEIHIAYYRNSGSAVRSIWEMHRSLNGIPGGAAGERTRQLLADIVETSVDINTSDGTYRIPDAFHHGLVLLLHTAAHLTAEGIGLRHLCDWAVFAASLSDEDFVTTFGQPLEEIGLWRFAQLLTLCSIRYLGCPTKTWAGEADGALLEAMITDIMTGGNFGTKDDDRYRQIKYISNRGEHTVDKKSPLRQVVHTMNRKVQTECGFAARHPALLPAGWVVTGGKYLKLVLTGRRKADSVKTLESAKTRKDIYRQFCLFEIE